MDRLARTRPSLNSSSRSSPLLASAASALSRPSASALAWLVCDSTAATMAETSTGSGSGAGSAIPGACAL